MRLAVKGGVQIVQLRDKATPEEAVVRRARKLARIGQELEVLTVVNDRPSIARDVGADGAHVGQEDLPAAQARSILGSTPLLGVSTHDRTQVRRASRSPAVDYLGVGPIFPTGTKPGSRPIGPRLLEIAQREASLPVFALGGIDSSNLDAVLATGCRRIAVSRAILASPDPHAAARDLRARLDRGV